MSDKNEKQQHAKPQQYSAPRDEKADGRLIVRITGIDLDGKKSIQRALTKIKGIGVRMGKNIAIAFEGVSGIAATAKLGTINEEQARKLEEIALSPAKFGIPVWSLNRQKNFFTGENRHVVMSELDLGLREDLTRLKEIKSYRGLRHQWGLPVRGQSTKSTHRGKGVVVGVMKKDIAKAQAPAKAGAPAKPAAGAKPAGKK